MGRDLGAEVHLDRAPLKYAGLSPTEVWISEAQERMILAVPPDRVSALREVCGVHEVEVSDLGHFGTPQRDLQLLDRGAEVGRLSMVFLHEGMPQPVREAEWSPKRRGPATARGGARQARPSPRQALPALLAHPNIASKRWIIRQYDHEVQGRTVIKPCAGPHPRSDGPSDAAVFMPVPGSLRGLAIACGLATGLKNDPYLMALAAIDECVRNLVCVGADPSRIAILDNFCWPGVKDPPSLGELVRAAEGCYDGARAYRTPFISGKDSLNNQFTAEDGRTIRIPPTLLISGIGIVPDIRSCVTMDAKSAGNLLVIIGSTGGVMGGSHFERLFMQDDEPVALPRVDLRAGPAAARVIHQLIRRGLVRAAHDVSDGGMLVAAAEMAIAGDLGLSLDLHAMPAAPGAGLIERCFSEEPGRYLLEVAPGAISALREQVAEVPFGVIGEFRAGRRFELRDGFDVPIDELRSAWLRTLDW
jgi:phosphoribosylformylglycinamidine synthase